jgi:hypothetical protein
VRSNEKVRRNSRRAEKLLGKMHSETTLRQLSVLKNQLSPEVKFWDSFELGFSILSVVKGFFGSLFISKCFGQSVGFGNFRQFWKSERRGKNHHTVVFALKNFPQKTVTGL